MIPIPQYVLDTFPLAPSGRLVQGRPWWRWMGTRGVYSHWQRWDGATADALPDGRGRPGLGRPEGPEDGAWFARYDEAYPIPHPGFFPGQLWALLTPQAAFGPGALMPVIPHPNLMLGNGRSVPIAAAARNLPFVRFGDQGLSYSEFHTLFAERGAILLTDPRGINGPWAPSPSTRAPSSGWLAPRAAST